MSSTKEPAPELDVERQRTDENLLDERAKVDALLEDPAVAARKELVTEAREGATEALESDRERVDEELGKHAHRTVVDAVSAERERADERIALERDHADELQRLEHERLVLENQALQQERISTDEALVTERGTTDATIIAQAERLQIVSHDLKNPLQSIVTSAAMLLRDATSDAPLDAERARQSAERIERAARTMDRLIGDLLTSASLDLGSLPLTLEPHDLAALVEEVMKTLESLAARKRLRFRSSGPDVPLRVCCDVGRLSQALSNVVANAIKFTPEGAEVVVLTERAGDEARLSVLDSGPGVPAHDAAHIFERHFRGSAQLPSGLGLGLYIAKTIVELHDGRIGHEPRKDVPGTVFSITLPLVPW